MEHTGAKAEAGIFGLLAVEFRVRTCILFFLFLFFLYFCLYKQT
jgi:hypothetical protein